jgi:hypothetical protein
LIEAKVDFILIGGYAVIYHGYVRTTGDMDVWLRPDNENKVRFLSILEKHLEDKSGVEKVRKQDFTGVVAFHIGTPPDRVDFLTKMSGIKYNEAFSHREFFQLKNYQIPVLNLNDLLINKLLSDRSKDRADVDELRKIIAMRK